MYPVQCTFCCELTPKKSSALYGMCRCLITPVCTASQLYIQNVRPKALLPLTYSLSSLGVIFCYVLKVLLTVPLVRDFDKG